MLREIIQCCQQGEEVFPGLGLTLDISSQDVALEICLSRCSVKKKKKPNKQTKQTNKEMDLEQSGLTLVIHVDSTLGKRKRIGVFPPKDKSKW